MRTQEPKSQTNISRIIKISLHFLQPSSRSGKPSEKRNPKTDEKHTRAHTHKPKQKKTARKLQKQDKKPRNRDPESISTDQTLKTKILDPISTDTTLEIKILQNNEPNKPRNHIKWNQSLLVSIRRRNALKKEGM